MLLLTSLSFTQTINQIPLNPEHLGTACKAVCGTYYNGSTWIFFDDYHQNSTLLNYLHYVKAKANGLDIELVKDETTSKSIYDFNFKDRFFSSIQPACAVFNGMLYLFVTKSDDKVWYTYYDGTTWIEPVQLTYNFGSTSGNVTTVASVAATTLNGKLYLFFQLDTPKKEIYYVTTVNGTNWITLAAVPMGSYTSRPEGNISATTFSSLKDTKEHIMIAFPFTNNECKIMCFDDTQGWYLQNTLTGSLVWGTGLSQGSRGALNGAASSSPVQLVTLGDNKTYGINEFYSETGLWGTWQTMDALSANDSKKSFPTLLSGFKTVNNSLQKELWYTNISHSEISGLFLKVMRIDSDKLTPVETISEAFNNPSHIKYWKMFGVIEGPPPFALNANSFGEAVYNNTYGPSVFTYVEENTTEATYSTSWSVNTSVSASGAVGVLSMGADLSAALKNTNSKDTTFEFKSSQSVRANQSSLGYYCFYKPTITRTKYSLQSFNGNDVGLSQYIFNVTDAQIILKDFDLTTFAPNNFNTSNIWTYFSKPTSGYQLYPTLKKASLGFSWTQGLTVENSKTFSSSTTLTKEGSVSITLSAGIPEIFNVSAGFEIGVTEQHKTTFGQQISVLVNCPDPRPGYQNDIKYFAGEMFWLDSPEDGNAYWVPQNYNGVDYRKDKPWLVTYTVYNIETVGGTSVEKIDDKIPDKFSLLQNYPNPFNPETKINYSIPKQSYVVIKIYDILGKEVEILVNQEHSPGNYQTSLNGEKLNSGVYFCKIQSGNYIEIKKMNLIK
jgi:hypothetical protein